MIYNNYHKHTMYSNIFTPDTPSRTEDYCKRAIELGHDKVFTTEHGYGGDVFNAKEVCDSFALKCIFGFEGYIVPDISNEKDNSNYHIFIAPKNNDGRHKLNKIISNANEFYYYYKPRINLKELLELDSNGFIITTACIAGIARDDIGTSKILEPLLEHFKDNVYFEVQSHYHPKQIEHNKRILELQKKYNIPLISANDSHYIYPEDAETRVEFLNGKHINYGEEDSFVLDYPSYETLLERYKKQGVLSYKQIESSIHNTLVFDECDEIDIDKSSKMPSIFKDLTRQEKLDKLRELSYEKFKDVIVEDEIPEEAIPQYKKKLDDCLKVIEDTQEMDTADYFLLDEKIVNLAITKYGGVITRTGRGSGGAFYLNRVLGLTQLDSETTNIPIYPDRFMSTARILENRSYPDIDLNIVKQEPFVRASKDLLGEEGCIPMLAFGTMQLSESFRNICRSMDIPFEEFNDVAKNVENYREDKRWKPIIEKADKLVDVIVSGSVHPCAHLLLDRDIREEIGCVRLKENICCIITSDEADAWKYLKNDYLIVKVWEIISEVFKELKRPIMSLKELRKSLDNKVWEVYEKGLTCTVNQVDTDFGTSLSMRYKPRSIDEVAKLTAAIRPSFDPWRESFITRKRYTTNSQHMDDLLSQTDGYILFQENIMQYFEWLGVSPAESIGLIKKISKKKIKEKDFKDLENRIKQEWIRKTGSVNKFQENWDLIQSCMFYSFNCISGSTKIMRGNKNGKYEPTVEEMYFIMNNRDYARATGHLDLHEKYVRNGYGTALSMFDDDRLYLNKIWGIKYAGVKKTYKVVTESGCTITCTDNHKFPTPDGKKMLKDIGVGGLVYCCGKPEKNTKKYVLTDGNFDNNFPSKGQCGFQKNPDGPSVIYDTEGLRHLENKDSCEICGKKYDGGRFELHHKDLDRTNNLPSNLSWCCASCHKKEHYKNGRTKRLEKGIPTYLDRIASIEYVGEERVYDISMEDPAHNFVSESGLVTANSPHALGYGYDSAYGAYLKSHFPLEYFSVALNINEDSQEKTSRLIKEMNYYGISLKGIKFRRSRSNYSYDKDSNSIYKGMKSIKYMNKQAVEELYSLKDNKYSNFVELLYDIVNRTSLNSRQLEILIRLDFFSEFGNAKTLLRIYDKFEYFKEGTAKQIAKNKVTDDVMYSIIERHSRQTDKTFLDLDTDAILNEIVEFIEQLNIPDFSIIEKMNDQLEYLGYVDFTTGKPEDRFRLVVLDVQPLKTKDKTKIWARKLDVIALGTGKKNELTVYEKYFSKHQLMKGDIIKIIPESLQMKEYNNFINWYLSYYTIE